MLNLGGVANVTYWDGGNTLVAFDTGPANAPLNDFMKERGLGDIDRDGALARSGKVDEVRLARLLQHPYLSAPPPKSLDRFDFTSAMAEGLDPATGAATLTAFTAAAVGKGLDLLPTRPKKLIVCGGGRHNPLIMEMLKTAPASRPCPPKPWAGAATPSRPSASPSSRCACCVACLSASDDDRRAAPPLQGGRLAA